MRRKRVQRSDIAWMLFAILMVVLQFWWIPGKAETPDDSFSASADGKLGLYRVLNRLYANIDRESDTIAPRESGILLLLSPDRYPNPREMNQLYEFVSAGGILVFAPNWNTDELDFQRLGFSIRPAAGPIQPNEVNQESSDDEPSANESPNENPFAWRLKRVLSAKSVGSR